MKSLPLLWTILLLCASNSQASIRPVRCHTDQPQANVSARILEGDSLSVIVEDVNSSEGYTVVSAEGIEGKLRKTQSFVNPHSDSMIFLIKSEDQNQKVMTYTFDYKQAGENRVTVSTCLVTVEKK